MFSEQKFQKLPPQSKAKKLSELLRILILQLGHDVAKAKDEYSHYAAWMALPQAKRLEGKNQAELVELYKDFRTEAGLGFERDVYLENEPGDRQEARQQSIPYAVLLHNLRSAFNVGSIIRTVDCFGLEAIHLSGYTPDLQHTMLKSAARGTERWIPSTRWESPLDCIQSYRQNGYEIIALETGEKTVPLPQVEWPRKALILLGNEELGIAPELLRECALQVEIPMAGRKASLNVANAFAVMAYAIRNYSLFSRFKTA